MGGVEGAVPAPLDLETAWQRFSDALRSFLRRRMRRPEDAEDVLQQVFLKLASAPPDDVPDERIGAWLYRVARNAAVDAHRRERVCATESLAPDTPSQVPDADTLDALAGCLEPMIRTLPETYAEALREVDLAGRKQRELAGELGLSLSAIKSRVQRGRALLRERFLACCGSVDEADACDDQDPCN